MESLRCCSVCGGLHSVLQCRDPRIRETWNDIFCHLNLRCPTAIEYVDDIRDFLEIEVPFQIIPALGVQYGTSDISDSFEDHITDILNSVRFEIEMVNTLSVEMREQYLQREYPEIYRSVAENIEDVEEEPINIQRYSLLFDNPEDNPDSNPDIECPICLENIEFSLINQTNCQHEFCHSCLLRHITTKTKCPLCRTEVSTICVRSIEQSDDMNAAFKSTQRQVELDDDDTDDATPLVEFLIQENLLQYITP